MAPAASGPGLVEDAEIWVEGDHGISDVEDVFRGAEAGRLLERQDSLGRGAYREPRQGELQGRPVIFWMPKDLCPEVSRLLHDGLEDLLTEGALFGFSQEGTSEKISFFLTHEPMSDLVIDVG